MGRKSREKRAQHGGSEDSARFHRDMIVWDAVSAHPGVKDVLLEFGLPCHQCVVAESETLAEGCTPLGLNVDAIVSKLNALPSP